MSSPNWLRRLADRMLDLALRRLPLGPFNNVAASEGWLLPQRLSRRRKSKRSTSPANGFGFAADPAIAISSAFLSQV